MNFNFPITTGIFEKQNKFFIISFFYIKIWKNSGILVKTLIIFYHYKNRIIFYLFFIDLNLFIKIIMVP